QYCCLDDRSSAVGGVVTGGDMVAVELGGHATAAGADRRSGQRHRGAGPQRSRPLELCLSHCCSAYQRLVFRGRSAVTLPIGQKLKIRAMVYVAAEPIPFFWP